MGGLIGFLKRLVKVPLEARFGRLDARYAHARRLKSIPPIREALATIQRRWPASASTPEDAPVFILSAGWRSGSTLLQRLVMSDKRVLLWGEPYARSDLVRVLSESLRIFTAEYPRTDWFIDQGFQTGSAELSDQWIANLYPPPPDLAAAHRAFFQRLYAEPVLARGYSRWGFKEVRLGIEQAVYLKWLYPGAKFLFLYRDPYKAYRSYRIWRDWYYRWPQEPIFTPRQFGELWRSLVSGYLEGSQEIGGMLVKYEDLVDRRLDLAAMSGFLGLALAEQALVQQVSGRGVTPDPVPGSELRKLRRAVDPLAERLGYAPES
jgi:hypothetical protein